MSNQKAKIIYGCVLVAVILGAISVLTLLPSHSSKTLNISYVGLTNSQYFGPAATFCASNTGNQDLSILFYSPQTKAHGWSPPKEQFLDIDGYLEPHQSVQFAVPMVTNQTPWRVIAKWYYEKGPPTKTLWMRVQNIIPLSWQRFFKTKKLNLSEDTIGPIYESYSPEIKNN